MHMQLCTMATGEWQRASTETAAAASTGTNVALLRSADSSQLAVASRITDGIEQGKIGPRYLLEPDEPEEHLLAAEGETSQVGVSDAALRNTSVVSKHSTVSADDSVLGDQAVDQLVKDESPITGGATAAAAVVPRVTIHDAAHSRFPVDLERPWNRTVKRTSSQHSKYIEAVLRLIGMLLLLMVTMLVLQQALTVK